MNLNMYIVLKMRILILFYSVVLMARIEDVIIKTIISGELTIAIASKMFVPFPDNCFGMISFLFFYQILLL